MAQTQQTNPGQYFPTLGVPGLISPPTGKPPGSNYVERIQEASVAAQEIAMFNQTMARLSPPAPAPAPAPAFVDPTDRALRVSMDVGQMFNAAQSQNAALQTALSEAMKLMASNMQEEQRHRIDQMQEDLKTARERMERTMQAPKEAVSPFAMLKEYQGLMKDVTSDLKHTLGLDGDLLARRTDDPATLLAIKKTELEGQERMKKLDWEIQQSTRKWEMDFTQWKEQLAFERTKFAAELQLRREDREENQKRNEAMMEGLMQVVGSLAGSIEVDGRAPAQPVAQERTAPVAAQQTEQVGQVITCATQGCGARFGVPAGTPSTESVACPRCETEYSLAVLDGAHAS